MRPSVNGHGVGGRLGVGVVGAAAITTLIAMALGLGGLSHAERGASAVDASRRAAQAAKDAATSGQERGEAALEAGRSSATSLHERATQDADRPSAADCFTVQRDPIGASWCKPSELGNRAQQDAKDASDGASSALNEQEQKMPNGVEVTCEGEGPSGTMPQAHATPPSVEDDGSSMDVTLTRPSVTPGTFDPGDRHCDPQTK